MPELDPTASPSRLTLVYRDLFWITLLGLLVLVLNTLLSAIGFLLPIRILTGLAYVLIIPGYCLSIVLFPRREDIDGYERAGLSLGLSVALVPILFLVINWLPWGIKLESVLLGQISLVTLLVVGSLIRRQFLPAEEIFAPGAEQTPAQWWRTQPLSDRRIYLFSIAGVLLAILALIFFVVLPRNSYQTTEFYILGPEGLAENYPRQATSGEILNVDFGIANKTSADHTYHILVIEDNFGVRQTIGSAGPFEVIAGETLKKPIEFTPLQTGADIKIEFQLFIDQDPQVHRRLELWLSVLPKP